MFCSRCRAPLLVGARNSEARRAGGMAALTAKQIHSILNSGADPSSPELQEALAAAEIELKAELGGRGPGVARLDLNDSAMLRRFLVARKLQVPATVAMLEAHAAWLEQTYPIALPEVPSQPQPATRAQPWHQHPLHSLRLIRAQHIEIGGSRDLCDRSVPRCSRRSARARRTATVRTRMATRWCSCAAGTSTHGGAT